MEQRIIRRAERTDVDAILSVFDAARKIMKDTGNVSQWTNEYPSAASVENDMKRVGAFVVEDAGRVVAYFAFLPSPDPTYNIIYDGQWVDNTQPYHVVHRIASTATSRGIFSSIINFCLQHDSNIRIDTHRDNLIMQHNLTKHGFTYCGIIHLANGSERLAYQRIVRPKVG